MTGGASTQVSKLQELIYELDVEQVMRRDVITVTPQTSMQDFKELLIHRTRPRLGHRFARVRGVQAPAHP